MNQIKTLFTPGPVKISKNVLKKGSAQLPYFRNEYFEAILNDCSQLILKFVNAEKNAKCIFLSCSGTGAMDAVISNFVSRKEKSIVVNGGTFGNRFCEILEHYKFNFHELRLEFGKSINKNDLKKINPHNSTFFFIQGHETSSGALNNLKLTGQFCKKNNLIHIVDGITTFISDQIDMIDQNIDILIISSQKGLALPPGLSFIILNQKAQNKLEGIKSNSYYFDLKKYLQNIERNQTPFTPTISIILQLLQRLTDIEKNGGIGNEINKCKHLANRFREFIRQYPLKIVAENPSNCLTALSPTDGKTATEIIKYFDKIFDIYLCPNGGQYSETVFRIAHIGDLNKNDILKLEKSIKKFYK